MNRPAARLVKDVTGVLRPELAGVEIKIVGKQVSGERVVAYYVLLPGHRFAVKLPARLVERVVAS